MLCAVTFSAEKYTIAMIPKGTTHEFWKSVHAGGLRAVEELKAEGITVDLVWKGPLKEDDLKAQVEPDFNVETEDAPHKMGPQIPDCQAVECRRQNHI